jgi:hypothetical protein
MIFTKFDAVSSLRQGCNFGLNANDEIEWYENTQERPTDAEIDAEVIRLQTEYDAKSYQRKRQSEYPSFIDYLDGVVKGDQAQIDKYIADCQAVKAKYPKG